MTIIAVHILKYEYSIKNLATLLSLNYTVLYFVIPAFCRNTLVFIFHLFPFLFTLSHIAIQLQFALAVILPLVNSYTL